MRRSRLPSRPIARVARAAAVSAVAVSALAGCGAGSDRTSATSAPATSTTATDAGEGAGSTTTTDAEEPTGDGTFCDDLLVASAAFDLLEPEAAGSPEEVRADFDEARDVLSDLTTDAPAELVDGIERLATAFETLDRYYGAEGYDADALAAAFAADPALADRYVADLAAIDADGRFDAESERITTYQRDVCGHDVD